MGNKINFSQINSIVEYMKTANKIYEDAKLHQFHVVMSFLLGDKFTDIQKAKGLPEYIVLGEKCPDELITILSLFAPCQKHQLIQDNSIMFNWSLGVGCDFPLIKMQVD